jgi:Bacterial Ig-like domain
MGRIAYVGMAVAASLAMVGCYSVPQPACGFFCGSAGECPDDYTCNTADNRCHLDGSKPQTCSTHDAGPIDAPDAPPDVPNDGNVAPTILGNTPANSATGVSVATTVTATFSEEVFGTNIATFTLKQGTTAIPATVVYTTGSHIAVLDPIDQLAANTAYTVNLTAGIGDDLGLPIPATTWMFTTGSDMVGPSVTLQAPAPAATGVFVVATVSARFDEQVMGVSTSSFTLKNGATSIPGTTTYTAGTKTARFTPDAQLPGNTLLTATLTAGITDTASNALPAAPVTWTFTTDVDNFPPTLQSSTPTSGATGISTGAMITVVFDEPVLNVSLTSFTVNAGAAVTGSLVMGTGGRSWTFTPSAALPAATMVTVTLSTAITDAAANALAAPIVITFMTQ